MSASLETDTIQFPGLLLSKAEARERGRTTTGLRFFGHSQWPKTAEGEVASLAKTVRLVWRPRGWWAALVFVDAAPPLPAFRPEGAAPVLGADLGFAHVITLSDGTTDERLPVEDRLRAQLPKTSRGETPHPRHQATRTSARAKREDREARRRGKTARLHE